MKKKNFVLSVAAILALSITTNSCIGNFAMTNKLLAWNRSIDNKLVNELVFFAFLIVPVYPVSSFIDLVVLNSIEFWSGTSPLAHTKKVIKGNDSNYLVESDSKGYTLTRLVDGTVTRLNYNQEEASWSIMDKDGGEFTFLEFVDDMHVKVPAANGEMQLVELSQDGLYAFRAEALSNGAFALK